MERLGLDVRRIGTAMVAFGLVGMVIAGIVAVGLISGAVAARNLDERLVAEQARLVTTLARVDSTMQQLVTTTDNAGDTLATTSGTLVAAGDVLGRVGDTAQDLSTSIDISILGSRPLASASARFAELATEVRSFQGDAIRLSENLAVNAANVDDLATELDLLREEVAAVSARVAAFEATGELVSLLVGGILLLGLLVAWLAVAAAGCAWLGLRLRRLGADAAAG
jgi:hypothetical protein